MRRTLGFLLVILAIFVGYSIVGRNLNLEHFGGLALPESAPSWLSATHEIGGWKMSGWEWLAVGIIAIYPMSGIHQLLFRRGEDKPNVYKQANKNHQFVWFLIVLVGVLLLAVVPLLWMFGGKAIDHYIHGPTSGIIHHPGHGSINATVRVTETQIVTMPARRESGWYVQVFMLQPDEFCPVKLMLGHSPNTNNHLKLVPAPNRPGNWSQLSYSPELLRALGERREINVTIHLWHDPSGSGRVSPFVDPTCP